MEVEGDNPATIILLNITRTTLLQISKPKSVSPQRRSSQVHKQGVQIK